MSTLSLVVATAALGLAVATWLWRHGYRWGSVVVPGAWVALVVLGRLTGTLDGWLRWLVSCGTLVVLLTIWLDHPPEGREDEAADEHTPR